MCLLWFVLFGMVSMAGMAGLVDMVGCADQTQTGSYI
jgi:hypothetical protein